MDPFTLVAVLAATYFFAAPDRVTAGVRGGIGGAIRSGGSAAGRSARSGWAAGKQTRSKKRAARRARWDNNWIGSAAVGVERRAAGAGRAAWGAVKDGAKATPAGWQSGRASARPGIPVVRDRVNAPKLRGFTRARPAAETDTEPGDPARERQWADVSDPDLAWLARNGDADAAGEAARRKAAGEPFRWEKGQQVDEETPAPTGDGEATPTEGQQEMANGDGTAVRETDLTTVADLDAEAQQADGAAQSIDATLRGLAGWSQKLGDRYAAADFGTKAITDAVHAVVEAAPDDRVLIAFGEALHNLREAVAEAQKTVGEAVSSQQAEGKAEAFQAA